MSRQQDRWLKRHPQNNMQPKQPSKEELELMEKELNKELTLTFKKKELLVIFNILTRAQFQYGDWLAVKPIVDKIEPIVTVASNISESPILGTKRESN